MNTLVRSTTLGLSCRLDIGYGHLNQAQRRSIRGDAAASAPGSSSQLRSTFSRRRSLRLVHPMMTAMSYNKRDRAQKRHIFLQSYRLSSLNSSLRKANKSPPRNLKKAAVKVKSIVVSVLSFMRAVSVKSSNRRSAIAARTSSRVQTWF